MGEFELPADYMKRIEELEQTLNQKDFYVLVWGSGESAKEDYDKRLLIRNYLADTFGEDKVFLSEHRGFGPLVDRHGLAVAEALQARTIDAVVILDTSIGSHSEIVKYGDVIVGKAIVFISRAHEESESFANVAFDALKTVNYTPEEYRSCEKIRRRARDFLSALRLRSAYPVPLGEALGG